jgi:hypothetical protein
MGELFDKEDVHVRLEDYVRENGDCFSIVFFSYFFVVV